MRQGVGSRRRARSRRSLALHICFREQGFRWPLRDDYDVEVWTVGHELVATLSGRLIRQLVELHLAGAALQGEVISRLRKPPAIMARPGFNREQRRELKARRRARGRGDK